MRLGVLDIGSNTGHLLIVDAHAGAAPMPAFSVKEPLRLAEHLDDTGRLRPDAVDTLICFVRTALRLAEDKGCEEIHAFATSAIREADNGEEVLAAVERGTGVRIRVLPGEDEARLTFLAVRRWFGWSSGRLAVFDIGGGSLEIASGADEAPTIARSIPLGAGRVTRERLPVQQPSAERLRALRREVRALLAHDVGDFLRNGQPDHAVATSKTFRSLARLCGAAPSIEGPQVRRTLAAGPLEEWIPRLAMMPWDEIATLPGVSPARAHQLLAGAVVALAVFDIFEVEELEICPWALREGVILDRIDKISAVD